MLVAVGLPVLTAVLTTMRGALSLGSTLLVYLLMVVIVAVIGGVVPGVTAAIASSLSIVAALTVISQNKTARPPKLVMADSHRDALAGDEMVEDVHAHQVAVRCGQRWPAPPYE